MKRTLILFLLAGLMMTAFARMPVNEGTFVHEDLGFEVMVPNGWGGNRTPWGLSVIDAPHGELDGAKEQPGGYMVMLMDRRAKDSELEKLIADVNQMGIDLVRGDMLKKMRREGTNMRHFILEEVELDGITWIRHRSVDLVPGLPGVFDSTTVIQEQYMSLNEIDGRHYRMVFNAPAKFWPSYEGTFQSVAESFRRMENE
ncbi:hypothetical protein GF324_05115 [bacterium]|nr:hypothetical protein [bacterium]